MRPNPVLHAWREGGQTIGGWLSIDSSFSAEVMAQVGFDWICIDMQHGVVETEVATSMLQAISTTNAVPFVRVQWNEPSVIMQALDRGAYGVVVPMVNNRAEAAAAVAACRYPPLGIRSAAGSTRGVLYGGSDYLMHANEELACIVMIETSDGLANLDEILSTPGVDAAYIGPTDLALALGLPPGGGGDPKHAEAIERILAACQRHNVAAGIHTSSVELTRKYLDMGFHMVTLGSDTGFMRRTAAADLAAVREGPVGAELGEA